MRRKLAKEECHTFLYDKEAGHGKTRVPKMTALFLDLYLLGLQPENI